MASPTILGEVEARFRSDVALAGLMTVGATANPWMGEIPEGTLLPCCLIRHLGEIPDFHTKASGERPVLEKMRLQFLAYAVGAGAAEAIALAVKRRFDFCEAALNVTAATVIAFVRRNYELTANDQFRSPSGDLVFEANVEYEAWVQYAGAT